MKHELFYFHIPCMSTNRLLSCCGGTVADMLVDDHNYLYLKLIVFYVLRMSVNISINSHITINSGLIYLVYTQNHL